MCNIWKGYHALMGRRELWKWGAEKQLHLIMKCQEEVTTSSLKLDEASQGNSDDIHVKGLLSHSALVALQGCV